jgi:hypothetical protein
MCNASSFNPVPTIAAAEWQHGYKKFARKLKRQPVPCRPGTIRRLRGVPKTTRSVNFKYFNLTPFHSEWRQQMLFLNMYDPRILYTGDSDRQLPYVLEIR